MMNIVFEEMKTSILKLNTDEERKEYVKKRTQQICEPVIKQILSYLKFKRMTKKEFSERTKISKWRLSRILSGHYGGLSLMDIASIQSEFYGDHDKATRIMLTEKIKKQYQEDFV